MILLRIWDTVYGRIGIGLHITGGNAIFSFVASGHWTVHLFQVIRTHRRLNDRHS